MNFPHSWPSLHGQSRANIHSFLLEDTRGGNAWKRPQKDIPSLAGKWPHSSGRRWAIVCPSGRPGFLRSCLEEENVRACLYFFLCPLLGVSGPLLVPLAGLVLLLWCFLLGFFPVFPGFLCRGGGMRIFWDDWVPHWAAEGKSRGLRAWGGRRAKLQDLGQPDGQERGGSSQKSGQSSSASQLTRCPFDVLGWNCPQIEGQGEP